MASWALFLDKTRPAGVLLKGKIASTVSREPCDALAQNTKGVTMIEAVSTSVVNTQQNRVVSPESGARSQAALDVPENNIREAVAVPYISPVVNVDLEINQVVLQFRDSETGEVQDQIPSQRELQAFDRSKNLATGTVDAESGAALNITVDSASDNTASGQATGNAGEPVTSRVSVSV